MAYYYYNSKSARSLNVKQMKETIVNYCGADQDEFNRIFDSFRMMAVMGFISSETWRKFLEAVDKWTIVGDKLLDMRDDEEVEIYDFDNGRDGKEWEPFHA